MKRPPKKQKDYTLNYECTIGFHVTLSPWITGSGEVMAIVPSLHGDITKTSRVLYHGQ